MGLHLQNAARAGLDHTQLLVLARGGKQAAVSVEGHAEDHVRVAVDHLYGLTHVQVPDEDLRGQTCRRWGQLYCCCHGASVPGPHLMVLGEMSGASSGCTGMQDGFVEFYINGSCVPVTQIHYCPWADPSPSLGSVSATNKKDTCSLPGSSGWHTSFEVMPWGGVGTLPPAALVAPFSYQMSVGTEWAFTSSPSVPEKVVQMPLAPVDLRNDGIQRRCSVIWNE